MRWRGQQYKARQLLQVVTSGMVPMIDYSRSAFCLFSPATMALLGMSSFLNGDEHEGGQMPVVLVKGAVSLQLLTALNRRLCECIRYVVLLSSCS